MKINLIVDGQNWVSTKNIAMDNQNFVVIINKRLSDFSRPQTNFDLYSNKSILLVGMNLDGVVDE